MRRGKMHDTEGGRASRLAAAVIAVAMLVACGGSSDPEASPTTTQAGAQADGTTSPAAPVSDPAPAPVTAATCAAPALLAASDVSRAPLVSRDFYVVRFACDGELALAVLSYRVDNPNGHLSEALFRDVGGEWVQLARSGPHLLPADLAGTNVAADALAALRSGPGEVGPTGPAPRQDIGPEGFLSPSGNIGCYISPVSARCDIREREWQTPPKPADCDTDWGHALGVGAEGPGQFRCAGDTAIGGQPVLAYGSIARRGPFECRSEERGMECVNLETGHGIAVSRAEFRLF